jgi:hypothetical protein
VQPFFAISLDLARLTNNSTAPGGPGNGTNVRYDDFVFEILVDRYIAFNANNLTFPPGVAADPTVDRTLTVTVRDESNAPVGGVQVAFAVENAPRLTIVGAPAATPRMHTVTTASAGATAGQATITLQRAAGAGNDAGVTGGVLVTVQAPTTGAGGEAEYPQEFFVPVGIP